MSFCYNNMMLKRKTAFSALAGLIVMIAVPVSAYAYLNPYDVLLSNDLFLPTTARESLERVERQQRESAARRDREQEIIFAEQHPPLPEEEVALIEGEPALHAAAPLSGEDELDREFLALLRALERIQGDRAEREIRQQAFLLLQEQGIELHGGAPMLAGKGSDLAPTGAGTTLAIMLLLIVGVWTIRRAKRGKQVVVS